MVFDTDGPRVSLTVTPKKEKDPCEKRSKKVIIYPLHWDGRLQRRRRLGRGSMYSKALKILYQTTLRDPSSSPFPLFTSPICESSLPPLPLPATLNSLSSSYNYLPSCSWYYSNMTNQNGEESIPPFVFASEPLQASLATLTNLYKLQRQISREIEGAGD